ncbi:MAG: ATP-binding cassette domain-containing protein [Pseudomonadota bacterium]
MKAAMQADPWLLSLEGVSLVYRALPALKSLHWRPREGEQWACLGPNGAGKTSVARVLSGQARHYSGEVRFSEQLQQQGVAYVCFEQARALCERDRKLDDSEFRADASDPGTTVAALLHEQAEDPLTLEHWIHRLGMAHILDRGLRFISTGEMRKTLLVHAILSEPRLLILDSPLDGLDKKSQHEMRSILEELLNSAISILLLSRQIEDIPDGISHVLVLDKGKLLVSGPREDVLPRPHVQSLMHPPQLTLGLLPKPAERDYALPETLPLLQLCNVSVSYGELTVLDRVNWAFELGDHCCIAGPNGCGKTTLLSLITGDNHKAYGQDITLFGVKRGSGESIWDIKKKFGQLDTQLHLNFSRQLTVLEAVISGFFDSLGLYDPYTGTQRETATSWLHAFGLSSQSQKKFDSLSFGLQRMVLLARAMVKSPIILLLDEPTLGLDGHHRSLILRAIDHIAANSDTQVIFVSHSVGELPQCINQQLTFEPSQEGFELISSPL